MLITLAGEDARLVKELESLLGSQSYKVATVSPLTKLVPALKGAQPQLLVLARPASRAAGLALMKAIREVPSLRPLPILCVDPKAGVSDGVDFLDAGADDFIHRPFNPRIFLARVRSLLRRRIWSGEAEEEPVTALHAGPLTLLLVSRAATLNGAPLVLTRLEFDLLAFLMKHGDRAFKREELLEAVWNYPEGVETRTLDKHVETLRRKLGAHSGAIQTVHGVGYRFIELASGW